MRIKNLLSFALLLFTTIGVYAQDLMVTNGGDVIKAYGIEVAGNAIFYRLTPNEDDAIQRIAKGELLMIKREDGTVTTFGEAAATSNTPAPVETVAETPQSKKSEKPTVDRAANDLLIERFNQEVLYTGSIDTKNPNTNYFFKFNAESDCVFEDSNIKVVLCNVRINSRFDLFIENKSDQTIHIDLSSSYLIYNGSSFVIREKGNAVIQSASGTSGAAVNMGGVANALGAGRGVAAAASAVTVGGSKTNTTSQIIEDHSHIVSLPPGVSKYVASSTGDVYSSKGFSDASYNSGFGEVEFIQGHASDVKQIGDKTFFTEQQSPEKVSSYIVYYNANDLQNQYSVKSNYYLSQIIAIDNSTSSLSAGWSQNAFYINEGNRVKVKNKINTLSFGMDMGFDFESTSDEMMALGYAVDYTSVRYKHISGKNPSSLYIGYGAGVLYGLSSGNSPGFFQVCLKARWGFALGGNRSKPYFWNWGLFQPYVGFNLAGRNGLVFGVSAYEYEYVGLVEGLSCTIKLVEYNSMGHLYVGGFKIGWIFGPKSTTPSNYKVKWD